MITEKEIEQVNLSATKKDFYQIWNELMDTARKLSERWDPSSTNESDPGIVLLKVLTAIADKLNYTIDKNTLEAFMPSAAQEESMRKLCDMLGYNMKYYQSATTDVTISYIGDSLGDNTITLPKYTPIKNIDEDITYFTLKPITFDSDISTRTVSCMEGEAVDCAQDTDYIIQTNQLDDSFRYFLPESQIAENGIFVTNIDDTIESDWEKVDNLNTQQVGKKCFKFGFDSKTQMPYVQFPEDIETIIKDGLKIKYARTNGINGNIAYNVLTTLEVSGSDYESTDFAVKNASAALNGRNKESLDDAYNNYKKTIGTFDTLVTCRDYMNKIYQMTTSDANTTPLVSNVIVSDIRDDINRAATLCTFNEYGIAYVDNSKKTTSTPIADKISHFDLVLYPFTTITGSVTKDNYKNSFKYSATNISEIEQGLSELKTISHNFTYPADDEIVCIKNYLKLKAKITTTFKVNSIEEKLILASIYSAIYNKFNARNIDFGEEIPFDTILDTIQNADTRIKNVALEEPVIYTKFLKANGTDTDAAGVYNSLALRNVLAGRVPLFKYDTDFKTSYSEKAYPNKGPVYPTGSKTITKLESDFTIAAGEPEGSGLKLKENEIIQFRSPNFKTVYTYPAYVNYFLHLTNSSKIIAAGEEYQLTDSDWLAINYTESVTNDDGTTSTGSIINKVYDKNSDYNVIKPNFELKDSNVEKAAGKSVTKKTGYDGMPDAQKGVIDGTSPKGMFTFGTSEQVEIRGVVQVVLDANPTYLYWERNDEDALDTEGELLKFKWDEDETSTGSKDYRSYTLKEGEYLYYTDSSKIDLAYYGNGTKITRSNSTLEIYKRKVDATKLAEQIASEGLLAALPWLSYNFTKDTEQTAGTNLVLTEYQYINLVAGDTLKALKLTNTQTQTIGGLTKKWTKVNFPADTKYQYKDSSEEKCLDNISVIGAEWYARSILSINSSPEIAQTLHKNSMTEDKLTIYYTDEPKDELFPIDPAGGTNYKDLSFKTNYIVQTSSGEQKINTEKASDFKVKVFENTNIKCLKGNTEVDFTDLGNFGDGNWTKITFNEYSSLPLNINLQSDTHGLIMFYYIDKKETLTDHAYLVLTDSVTPKICNSSNGTAEQFTSGWWKNGTKTITPAGTGYCLRNGMNIVEIPASCTLTIYSDTEKEGVLIFGMLDAAKWKTEDTTGNFVICPRLDYKVDGETSPIKQVLKDIYNFDKDYNFYYNAVIDNSIAIDFNENIKEDEDGYEKLSTPTIWYSYNNVNNKFVISEIDASYLETGITLTSASRKQ